MDDKSKMLEQLVGLIGGENGAQNIASILQGLGNTQTTQKMEPASAPMPIISAKSEAMPNVDSMQKIKSLYDSVASDNDPRINLLTALLPYMGERRSNRLQSAMKAIKMTKIVGIVGSLDKL